MNQPNLRHLVLLAFKASATAAKVQTVEQTFVRLETQVEEVAALEWGLNVSPEQHDHGFSHCFLLTFSSEADRDAYLTHPAHLAFNEVLKPWLENVCVIDYWV